MLGMGGFGFSPETAHFVCFDLALRCEMCYPVERSLPRRGLERGGEASWLCERLYHR